MSRLPRRVWLPAAPGSWLAPCEALLSRGHQATCLDSFLTGAQENVRHLESDRRFTVVHADMIDPILPRSVRR